MIYCVWYPSGGFGHFINAVISSYGENFLRPEILEYEFTSDGSSHNFPINLPYYTNNIEFTFDFDPLKNNSVLIDNGIDDESKEFYSVFPNSVKIKLCYSEETWPVVAETSIRKAMRSSIEDIISLDQDKWDNTDRWAIREKYFLFLRDHPFRNAWKHDHDCICIYIEDLRDYAALKLKLKSTGIILDEFRPLWVRWNAANDRYFKAVDQANHIINQLESRENFSLSHITDLWEQAVIYYLLWLRYNQEIPHYDYADFFADTDEIKSWLSIK